MRVSIGDDGAHLARVFLDGIEQKYVLMADSTLNYLRRFKRKGGAPVLDVNCAPIVETLFGNVVIEMPQKT